VVLEDNLWFLWEVTAVCSRPLGHVGFLGESDGSFTRLPSQVIMGCGVDEVTRLNWRAAWSCWHANVLNNRRNPSGFTTSRDFRDMKPEWQQTDSETTRCENKSEFKLSDFSKRRKNNLNLFSEWSWISAQLTMCREQRGSAGSQSVGFFREREGSSGYQSTGVLREQKFQQPIGFYWFFSEQRGF